MIQIPNESLLRSASQVAITDTAGASLIQAVGAGFTPYLRQATVSNVHDTVDTMVKILSGTTVVAILPAGPKGGVPAFYGEQGIPEHWRHTLARRQLIESLADQLYQLSAAVPTREPATGD